MGCVSILNCMNDQRNYLSSLVHYPDLQLQELISTSRHLEELISTARVLWCVLRVRGCSVFKSQVLCKYYVL